MKQGRALRSQQLLTTDFLKPKPVILLGDLENYLGKEPGRVSSEG